MSVNPISSDLGEICEEEIIVPSPIIGNSEKRLSKRSREDDGEEAWVEIRNRKERRNELRGIIDICITSTDILPKQFALAKIFMDQGITDINRVKYINPYKIIVEVNGMCSAEKLTTCEYLLGLGWRFQRPMEVGLSYGVIKHIELNLSEKELLDAITSVYEVASLKRLKRRAEAVSGWTDSEAVRLGFKGPSLPSYIHIYGMRVKVEPYMFPVTQCSRCWRFGHTIKMCPSKRVFCPKCGGKHENCPTTVYKCINCTKDHMALDRSCPEYRREKKVREIMAEFNVSYRKAITMYVPPQLDAEEATCLAHQSHSDPRVPTPVPAPNHQLSEKNNAAAPTFAQVASSRARKTDNTNNPEENSNTSDAKKKKKQKKKKQKPEAKGEEENRMSTDSEVSASDYSEVEKRRKKKLPLRDVPFTSLTKDIISIFCSSNISLNEKIETIAKLCVEWIIYWIVQNISSLPVLQGFMFNYGQG
ncbi:unnamed protein product [Euphydryas editha]|uniref:Gag-like protein n=1 Tax=Euphydryas editha TaxID=104508 RepID=A0AAU9TIA5_EUPED|nr:unnamed protein product [Euphydryas editha]